MSNPKSSSAVQEVLEISNAVLSARNVGRATGDVMSLRDEGIKGAVTTAVVNGVEYGTSKSGKNGFEGEEEVRFRSRRQNSCAAGKSGPRMVW